MSEEPKTLVEKFNRYVANHRILSIVVIAGDSQEVILDVEAKKVTFKVKREPHIPQQVFKTLCKMALSVVPKDELKNFDETVKWIFNEDLSDKFVTDDIKTIFHTFVPGLQPFVGLMLFLFRRRDDIENVPYMVGVLAFGHQVIQFIVPSIEQDVRKGPKEKTIKVMPNLYHRTLPLGSVVHSRSSLASCDVLRGDVLTMTLGFQSITESPPPSVSDTV